MNSEKISNNNGNDASKIKKGVASFWSLIFVMFQGALSDNLFKFLLMMLIMKDSLERFPKDEIAATAYAGKLTSIAEALFILPFAIAATLAGWFGDRFSKSKVTLALKILEFVIMSAGVFTLGFSNITGALIVLFFMGLQSALFSPSKYGILPELLDESRLGWANGILQGGTFIAIIIGTASGAFLFGEFTNQVYIPCLMLVLLALLGSAAAYKIMALKPADPEAKFSVNPVAMLTLYGKEILKNSGLMWGVFGMFVWWMVAVMLQGSALLAANKVLALSYAQTGVALLPIVIGMGIGCFLTGVISKNRIELGLVPFGAVAMFLASLFSWIVIPELSEVDAMSVAELSHLKITVPFAMGLVGLVSGFFIVPLQAYVIQSCAPSKRGGVWAVSNVITSVGMIIGAAVKGIVIAKTSSPGLVFLISALIMLFTGIFISIKFPHIPLRFLILFFLRGLYRINVKGVENIPKDKGALITPNHQSYLDAILMSAAIERPIRFIIADDIYKIWFIYPFAKLTKSIPVKALGSPRALIYALREASAEIERGGLVCIFPEGQVTRLGMMLPYRRGFRHIVKKLDSPIIPVAIDNAYNTAFALRGGRSCWGQMLHFCRKRRTLNVIIGEPLSPETDHVALRKITMDLNVEAFNFRKKDARPLHIESLDYLKNNLSKKIFADPLSGGMASNLKMLAGTVALGKKLSQVWGENDKIGIMLPPSIGATITNLAATTAGKIPVNLNYTSSPLILSQICEAAKIEKIITSKTFLSKLNMALPEKITPIYLEDIKEKIGAGERIAAMFQGIFYPIDSLGKLLKRKSKGSIDDTATIIFSSGSTGIPKGVELSHWNITANIRAAFQMVDFPPDGKILGILPYFHSFGSTVVLWLPLIIGYKVIFHPNPLHGREIGNLVEQYKITHLLTTPTILNTYIKRVQPEQFGSLIMVLTGAEKLRASVADEFEKRFGIKPIEGFGTTECSPIVSLNTPDLRKPGIYQKGTKHGTIGHPIPGTTVKILDMNTGESLPINQTGMLCVKGHNVMTGYYLMPDKTSEVVKDGWYITGDIAKIDDSGFITITDRLSRFSKIGGEMVPHIKIEDALYQLAGINDTVFAVTGIPDEKKGERLVVLYSIKPEEAKKISAALLETNLPPLWIPRWQDFICVEEIPILGTGKLDLQQVKKIALAKK